MVDRGAVDDRVAARGVVADHAAERGPVGVEVSGPNASPWAAAARLRSSCTTPGPTGARRRRRRSRGSRPCGARCRARCRGAHGLAGEARAAAAGDDRHTEARGGADGGGDVVGVARERDQQRRRSRTGWRRRRRGGACSRRRGRRRAARGPVPARSSSTAPTGMSALADVRVLELTQVMAGPVLRPGAGRHGRRRDQGRAAGRGLDARSLGFRMAATTPRPSWP